MFYITAEEGSVLNIGNQGENGAITVRFPISDWIEHYGEGTAILLNKRTVDPDGYPCEVTVNGGYAYWTVTDADTAYKGKGECQLIYTVDGVKAKKKVYTTYVDKSLGASSDPPLPWQGWIDSINSNLDKQKIASMDIQKLADYLYYAEYSDWDYTKGNEYFGNVSQEPRYCSSVRKGNWYGRNFDWFYDESATFVIKSKAVKGRHASIGVAGGSSNLTKAMAESGEWTDMYNVLPFLTLDGINDAGVVCNINVVPAGDKGHTTGTNQEAAETMYVPMIIRYVLDNADSAEDAIEKIRNVNWKSISEEGLSGAAELHAMIADTDNTYIVEFVENEIRVLSDADDEYLDIPNAPIMTNFYLDGWDGDIVTGFDVEGGISPEDTTLTPYAEGTERYQIVQNGYDSIASMSDMEQMMKSIRYTKAFDGTQDPFWYSELVGETETFGDLTVYNNAEDFAGIKDVVMDLFANRQRDGKTWQTVHTSVYDIANKSFVVIPQENDGARFEFRLTSPAVSESGTDVLYQNFDPDENYPEGSIGAALKALIERDI